MIGRVVEIAGDGRHLSLTRGFMRISQDGTELGRIPLDDVAAVIANGHGLTYSNNLVLALADRGATFVLCGPNHSPKVFLWPIEGHHAQNANFRFQLGASKPLQKRLWRTIVQAKVRQQGAALRVLGRPHGAFDGLARKVRSGDPDNIEARAARRYWPAVFGSGFRRDTNAGGINGLLNYGYTILRSATARAVLAAGLHPTLGLHNSNRANAMCLVDDLMEPFRPLVDLTVHRLGEAGIDRVTKDAKRILVGLTVLDMQTANGVSPLGTCLERLAQSLVRAFECGRPELDLPLEPLPLDLTAAIRPDDGD